MNLNPEKPPLVKDFKYEMAIRKEKWKEINDPIEKQIFTPLEAQLSVIQDLVSDVSLNYLASMLDLPQLFVEDDQPCPSVETIIPYVPPESGSEDEELQNELLEIPRASTQSTSSRSTKSSQDESVGSTVLSRVSVSLVDNQSEIKGDVDSYEAESDFVEVEKRTRYDHEMMLKHKAILRFLSLSEAEAACWRVKDARDISDLSQMTLEEKGDYLINKIAVDFCNWIRELGGDEKSFISEEIVKELFQIGMDNPASRAICMKTREKRVLYYNLASFLQMPDKYFHEVLSKHLNWDAEIEKKPPKLIAFGQSLPKNLRFKTPKNKTAETWLEWNKLSEEQLSFADVYKSIKDLRSTKEYCRWMAAHPEHKKPQYLVDQHVFDDPKLLDRKASVDPRTITFRTKSTIQTTIHKTESYKVLNQSDSDQSLYSY